MNILPKKSWHVRNRDNIARVRRDEALAAEEEKKKEAKIALAEQEARTQLLRLRAKDRHGSSSQPLTIGPASMPPDYSQAVVPYDEEQANNHINFFSELEEGKNTSTANKEHESDKKQEQEAYEKKIGLLTYLGQSSAESQTVKPWYQQGRKKEEEDEKEETKKTSTLDLKRKASMDPIHAMRKYLGKKAKNEPEIKNHPLPSKTDHPSNLSGSSSILSMFSKYRTKSEQPQTTDKESHKKHKHKEKKHHKRKELQKHKDVRTHHKHSHKNKKHKKHKRKSELKDKDTRFRPDLQETSSGLSMAQLRAERIRRETAERARTQRLLSGKPAEEQEVAEQPITDKQDGKYNSQFNPHLARRHQPKQPLF